MKLDQEDAPSLIEFTSSPFQQGQAAKVLERDHETHVWAMRGNSYGLVTIDVTGENEGTIRFEMRDANNYVPDMDGKPASYKVDLKDLVYAK